MGRKVHPIGFRLGINKTWEGRWFAEGKDYLDRLHQDFAVRKLVKDMAPRAAFRGLKLNASRAMSRLWCTLPNLGF